MPGQEEVDFHPITKPLVIELKSDEEYEAEM